MISLATVPPVDKSDENQEQDHTEDKDRTNAGPDDQSSEQGENQIENLVVC